MADGLKPVWGISPALQVFFNENYTDTGSVLTGGESELSNGGSFMVSFDEEDRELPVKLGLIGDDANKFNVWMTRQEVLTMLDALTRSLAMCMDKFDGKD